MAASNLPLYFVRIPHGTPKSLPHAKRQLREEGYTIVAAYMILCGVPMMANTTKEDTAGSPIICMVDGIELIIANSPENSNNFAQSTEVLKRIFNNPNMRLNAGSDVSDCLSYKQ